MDQTGGRSRQSDFAIPKRLRRLAREPMFHFFLIGAVLFAVVQWHKVAPDQSTVSVTSSAIQRIRDAYRQQFGSDPNPDTLRRLVDQYVEEEILYREGVARGLATGDEIIRRRIVQKMEFAAQDVTAPPEPTATELTRYYSANKLHYMAAPTVTFSHIYFSNRQGSESLAEKRARDTLRTLSPNRTRAPELGDSFPDLFDYAAFTAEQAERLFGSSEFSRMLFQAPIGRWSGPYRSSYGWHLVYVSARTAARIRPLAEVKDQVRADALAQAQLQQNQVALAAIKSHYKIVFPDAPNAR